MGVNVVAIPSINQLKLLTKLLHSLIEDEGVDRIVVMDNGYPPAGRAFLDALAWENPLILEIRDHVGWSIYEMWNAGWMYARQFDPQANLAIFNDDLSIPEDCISVLAAALEANPDLWVVSPNYLRDLEQETVHSGVRRTSGTYRQHGMAGFAFMFNVSRFDDPPFDESYAWWGGDDAFAKSVIVKGGQIGIVEGLPLEHVGEATSRHFPAIAQMKERDVERLKKEGMW